MKVIQTKIDDVLIFEPKVFGDDRGFFIESYNEKVFSDAVGRKINFVQDNHSRSQQHVLRGLHYQIKHPQGKLVRVTTGEVYDVAVDLRKHSATFGVWVGVSLSAENKRQLWVPEGFAHGFLVVSDYAEFLYKTSDFYAPEYERCLAWNDADLGVDWPLNGQSPVLSEKDALGASLSVAEVFE